MALGVMDSKILKNTADKIREKTGKTDSIYPEEFPAAVDEVYEAGAKSEYDRFWDEIQDNGNRTNYQSAFKRWSSYTITPKYKIIPTTIYELVAGCPNIRTVPPFEEVALDSAYAVCSNCGSLESFDYTIIASSSAVNSFLYNSFLDCQKLKTIKKVILTPACGYDTAFRNCEALENLTIEGVIARNGFNVQWSPLLTYESLISIINCLEDKSSDTSGTDWLITLGSANIAKLSAEDTDLINDKGWRYV